MLRRPISEAAVQAAQTGANKKPPRLDHFLAIPLHTPSVSKALETVQASLLSNSNNRDTAQKLKKCLVEPCTAHITLAVMSLGGEADAPSKAAQALRDAAAALQDDHLLQPFSLSLKGLSHFNNRVLYLDLCNDDGMEHLSRLAMKLRNIYMELGWAREADNKTFTPHVTIAKMSKLQGDRRWHKGRHKRHKGGNRKNKDQANHRAMQGKQVEDEREMQAQAMDTNDDTARYQYSNEYRDIVMELADVPNVGHTNSPATLTAALEPLQSEEPSVLKQLPPESYAQHLDINGGTVEITEIQLCSMKDRKAGQYYQVIERLSLLS